MAVPPLDDTLKKVTEPDADLLLPIKSVIDSFRRSLELKGNPLARVYALLAPFCYKVQTTIVIYIQNISL